MPKVDSISDVINGQSVLDTIKELEDEQEYVVEFSDSHSLELWDAVEGKELDSLRKFAKDCENIKDWPHVTLIRDSYFEEYAQELATDTGVVQPNQPWPLNCIDWREAADELKKDCTPVKFDETIYWVR